MAVLSGLFLINFLAVAGMMVLVWGMSLRMKNAGIIDIFWGMGFVLIAWITFFTASGYAGRQWLLTLMVAFWGFRLSVHLYARNWGEPEDKRYTGMRKRMGHGFWWKSLVFIFGFQAVLLWVISISVQVGQASLLPDHFVFTDMLGLIIWALGFTVESAADFQLAQFKSDPENRGRVMHRGLWHYSRHPNYFGESLVWWGIWAAAGGVPYGIFTVISPLLITFLLLRVSGVRLMERSIGKRRPEYRDYIRRTSAFVPWFPKEP